MENNLEYILKYCFNCKNPFRTKAILNPDYITDAPSNQRYDNQRYDVLTKNGWKAFNKLTDTVVELERMGAIPSAIYVLDKVYDALNEIKDERK